MSIFLKRWLLYLFVSMGLVLLLFPLITHHLEDEKRDFVFLKISETLVANDSDVKPKPTIDTSGDKTMEVLEKEFQKMQKLFSEQTTIVNTYGYPVLESDDLLAYPTLQSEIEEIMQRIALYQYKNSRLKKLDSVSVDEWNRFRKTFLSDSDAFQYGNRIFRGQIKSDYVSIEVEIDYLKLACKVIGTILLLLSFLLLRGLYMLPSKGIQIGKRTTMIIWDFIIIIISIFFASVLIDAILVKYFQTESIWGDDVMILYMSIYWVFLGNLIMALFTTTTSLQTVLITKEGIEEKGLFGRKFIAWSDVKSIQVSEYFIPRKVFDVYASRKVMKILKVQSDLSTLNIMEPPLPSTKEEVLDMLILYAPEALKKIILDLSEEWLSVW